MSGGPVAKLKRLAGTLLFLSVVLHASLNLYQAAYPYEFVDAFTDIAATILAVILTREEHVRNRSSSTTLLFYWLAVLLTMIVKIRSLILLHRPQEAPMTFYSYIPCVVMTLVMFILENLRKQDAWRIMLDEDDVSPEENANIWSRLTFSWMDPLFRQGYREKKLNQNDLQMWKLAPANQAHALSQTFSRHWNQELSTAKPSLAKAIIKTVGLTFMSAAPFKFAQDILGFVQPKLLRELLVFAQNSAVSPQPVERGVTIAILMFTAATIQSLLLHQYFNLTFVTGMNVRACIVDAVYRKALRLSPQARQTSTVGEVVNLMSVDAQKLMDLTTYLHILWSGLLQIVIALVMLYSTLGPSIFAGTAVMIIMIPFNAWLAKYSRNFQKIQLGNKDARIKLIDEVLNGIRVIKLYAWEIPFRQRVLDIRDKELATLTKMYYLNAVSSLLWSATPFFVAFTTFTVYSLTSDAPLTSTKVFVSLALFNILQFPLSMFPSVITSTVEASVSLNRIQRFLLEEETDPRAIVRVQVPVFKSFVDNFEATEEKRERIKISDASFSWQLKGPLALQDISLSVSDGELVCVTGSVASGKSSLIQALLGEMYRREGVVRISGKVAYVAQTAWIMNSTLRENVLFGKPYNSVWYRTVIEACSLLPDLAILPAGDQTEIGEKGINLSGGQRARVSLARAVYSKASIYLLDDPYSALDAHVAKYVFQKVIGPNGLLANKTRVFVTHGLAFSKECSRIVVMDQGRIVEEGTSDDLRAQGGLFANMMNHYTKNDAEQDDVSVDHDVQPVDADDSFIVQSLSKLPSTESLDVFESGKSKANGKMIQEESKAEGAVSKHVYWTYIRACGTTWVAIYLFLLVIAQALSVLNTFWLADWSGSNDKSAESISIKKRLIVYGALGFGSAALVALQSIVGSVFCAIRSAREMHKNMLDNVLHLPQSFFDTTPAGRIINRFTRDVQVVDDTLPRSFMSFFSMVSRVLGVVVMNIIATPLFVLIIVPLGYAYYYISQFYLVTSRELKRLDSMARSPMLSHFSETLQGVTTIRGYQDQPRFIKENEMRIDAANQAYFPAVTSNRWLAIRLEMLGNLMIFASALFAVIQIVVFANLSASLVGVAVSGTIAITQNLNWLIRQSTEIETNIISVERLTEYAELPQEAPYFVQENFLDKSWPAKGAITFNGYSCRYRAGLDLVLKDVSVEILPGEKIGIVGRTGSGKSTMSLGLFRIIEAAEGEILIDGVPIQNLGLFDLRSRMTVIPQDPVLWNVSLRMNLDPFETTTDQELWQALEDSHLKEMVLTLPEKLDTMVQSGGENFSLGQRQLLCLARALLRRSKILVLDEATSSTDAVTDGKIQETLRVSFKDSTLFTIAHRLGSLLDYDKIIVLDAGRIVESGPPRDLISTQGSLFRALAIDAGLISG
jgi:ATP-binding cassette subfamily C (CFTR/MRP) protein 1